VDWATARLQTAQEIVTPILADLCRSFYRDKAASDAASTLLVTTANAALPPGVYRATVDLPRHWSVPALTTVEGEPVPSLAAAIAGERDPLHGERSRVQMNELVTWLERGEIHEYYLVNCQLTCEAGALRLVVDLWPAALGDAPAPNPAAAKQLAAAIADPQVRSFFVHLRMPRRFALLFELAAQENAEPLFLKVISTAGEGEDETEKRAIPFFEDSALESDPSTLSLVVQLT
jgi:hypothetical protein